MIQLIFYSFYFFVCEWNCRKMYQFLNHKIPETKHLKSSGRWTTLIANRKNININTLRILNVQNKPSITDLNKTTLNILSQIIYFGITKEHVYYALIWHWLLRRHCINNISEYVRSKQKLKILDVLTQGTSTVQIHTNMHRRVWI